MAGKGQKKTGGRVAGTPNKTTKNIRQSIERMLNIYVDEGHMAADLMAIADPKDRINAAIKMMSYVIPQLQRIDLKENDGKRTRIDDFLLSLYTKDKDKDKE